MLISVRKEAGK